jgi:hypothetical protein
MIYFAFFHQAPEKSGLPWIEADLLKRVADEAFVDVVGRKACRNPVYVRGDHVLLQDIAIEDEPRSPPERRVGELRRERFLTI